MCTFATPQPMYVQNTSHVKKSNSLRLRGRGDFLSPEREVLLPEALPLPVSWNSCPELGPGCVLPGAGRLAGCSMRLRLPGLLPQEQVSRLGIDGGADSGAVISYRREGWPVCGPVGRHLQTPGSVINLRKNMTMAVYFHCSAKIRIIFGLIADLAAFADRRAV